MPMQRLNSDERNRIFQKTKQLVLAEISRHGRDTSDPRVLLGQCLEWAWQGYNVIKAWPGAPRTIIQAGSAQWPRVPAHLDDGVSPTHFAYEFNEDDPMVALALQGLVPVMRRPGDGHVAFALPEIHVWLGVPESGEIIDFTTGLWADTCEATIGLPWLAAKPPEFFWCIGSRRPSGVNYGPSRMAIEVVATLLNHQGRDYP